MDNPLLDHSDLPRFATITPDHVEPALDRVLDENLKAIDDILSAGPSFSWESLVEPVEALEHRLGRTWAPVGHLNAVMNNASLREAYNRCLPKLSRYTTEVGQNESLYRAYEAVAGDDGVEDPVRRAVLEHALRDFRLSGVALPEEKKARFKKIMERLSSLQARFEENVLDATNAWSRHFLKPDELDGLPEAVMDRAAEAADKKNLKGWLFTLDFPTFYAIQTHAHNRALREYGSVRGRVGQHRDHGRDPRAPPRGGGPAGLRQLRSVLASHQDGRVGGSGAGLPRGLGRAMPGCRSQGTGRCG
jgi:oligopeptidase A